MKVLITGGAGHIGKATTERFVQKGWEVRVIDLKVGEAMPGVEYVICDLLNYDEIRAQMRGCQSVVHLAAIPAPGLAAGHDVFQINVAGTFNIFEAAAAEGIKRIAQASSINALGCYYNISDFSPQYLPMDEAHPSLTNDPYSFSKELVEDIGRYFWRREGISSVAMRFPGVYNADYPKTEQFQQRREASYRLLEKLTALSETERQTQIAEARQRIIQLRMQRPLEFRGEKPLDSDRIAGDNPLDNAYMFDRFVLWAQLDVRDAAQSLEKGVTAEYEGAHPLYINDPENYLQTDSKMLADYFFPEISGGYTPASRTAALISNDKARSLIGFEAEYSLQKVLGERSLT